MSRKFLTSIDLNRNELQNGVIHNLATDPGTGVAGQLYFNTVIQSLKVYNGTTSQWEPVGSVELIGDAVNDLLDSGTGISLNYDDAGNSLTISNTGVTSVSGTVNEVTVSASAGAVTIGLPDSITANVTGALTGNASTANTLQTARSIGLGGSLSGSVSFDGSQNVTITADIVADSVALGADTTGDYVAGANASGAGISVTGSGGEGSTLTISNTGVTSVAGTANEVTVSGSAGAVTIGLPDSITANVTGALTGNASTASTLQTERSIGLSGDLSGSVNFNGSQNVTIEATIAANSVALGTDTTGDYVSGASASGAGISVTGSGGEGSSLVITNTGVTSITGTANEVTVSASAGAITVGLPDDVTIGGNLGVTGNLTVSGSVTTLNTETLLVEDNQITLNSNVTGVPAANAGIEVERGDSTNASLIWNESSDKWSAGLLGSETAISLEGHTHATSDITGLQEYVEDTVGTMLTDSSTIDFTYSDNSGSAGTLTAGIITASTSYLTTGSGLAVDISSVESKLVTDGFPKKYAIGNTSLTSTAGVCTWTVTHNLGTKDVTVQVYEVAADYAQVEVDVQHTSTSAITIKINSATTINADTYRVVVIG